LLRQAVRSGMDGKDRGGATPIVRRVWLLRLEKREL